MCRSYLRVHFLLGFGDNCLKKISKIASSVAFVGCFVLRMSSIFTLYCFVHSAVHLQQDVGLDFVLFCFTFILFSKDMGVGVEGEPLKLLEYLLRDTGSSLYSEA